MEYALGGGIDLQPSPPTSRLLTSASAIVFPSTRASMCPSGSKSSSTIDPRHVAAASCVLPGSQAHPAVERTAPSSAAAAVVGVVDIATPLRRRRSAASRPDAG